MKGLTMLIGLFGIIVALTTYEATGELETLVFFIGMSSLFIIHSVFTPKHGYRKFKQD